MSISFVECTSLNINFDVYGMFTATFSIYANTSGVKTQTEVAGLVGYVADAVCTPLINLPGWWVTNVTLIGTT